MFDGLATALVRWRAAIGDAHVHTDTAAPERATFATTQRIPAWLRPADRAAVQACLRIAHELRIPIHPVSRGRNWGYGSRVPPRDAVLLDLARLDRIVDFDERLAYVTVEPGVTFRQLATYLRTCRARVFASVTGGAAEGSVVANALERGDGSGPLGDRFAHICALEVVLPTGECVRTGFGRFPGALTAPLGRWGVGPALDGLFSQSGLGVVTQLTVWLTPYPNYFQLGSFALDDEARLPALVEALRGLKLAGVATATVPLWNDYKALALVGTYPWEAAAGVTPLPAAVRVALRERAGLGRWNGTLSLYGASRAHGVALRGVVEDALADRVDVLRFRDGPEHPLDADDASCGPALGVPHDHNLASAYWRKRALPARALDPDADRCGFLWLGHAVPFDGTHARTVTELVETAVLAAGFEPNLALLGITERMLSMVVAISYDRDVAGEDERARDCHDRLLAQLVAHGYPPFRLGIQSRAPRDDADYARVLDAVTGALDPHGILTRDR